ncbi:alpha/beta fold hydrolase [Janibacter sp. GXQ6167]|uniref:alpha/beta fold hydrolase n=1 Tax=Janibacter sp. GXQ6167 TaxID=3240791 RepID=UPI00352594B0
MKSSIEATHLAGERDPVVLIHGIGHRREAWGTLPTLLNERGYDVWVVDLPGHGLSPAPVPPDTYSMRSLAEQLERFFEAHDLDRPHVIGNSLGGQIVLELAHLGNVRTAFALAPAGFAPPSHLPAVGANLLLMKAGSYLPESVHRRISTQDKLRAVALRALYVHPERVSADDALGDALNLRASEAFWPLFRRGTMLRFTADLAVPTTIGWGDSDKLLPPSQAKVAQQRLPDARHELLLGCGHCPQIDEPDLVLQLAEETFAQARE